MMKVRCLTLMTLAVAGLLAAAPPARAEEEQQPTVEKRVVIHEGDSEPQVLTWTDKDGKVLLVGGRGYLGVQLVDLTPELRKHFGADEKTGVMVGRVEDDSPAAKAGVAVGDVITTLDGETVSWSGELGRSVRKRKAGETVRLDVVRNGRSMAFDVQVAERDPERLMLRKIHGLEGMELEPMGPAMERALRAVREPEIEKRMQEAIERRQERTRDLEERLKRLEQRLKEFEKQLEKNGTH